MYKVVFVDDEPITLQLLEVAIDWRRFGVTIAGMAMDGVEGLELFLREQPDIVIADIRMPVMSGIELCREIRRYSTTTKIMLLSAHAEFEYAQSAIGYQISEYLLKPLEEGKLEAALHRVLQEIAQERSVATAMDDYRLEQADQRVRELFVIATRQPAQPEAAAQALVADLAEVFGACDALVAIRQVVAYSGAPLQPAWGRICALWRACVDTDTRCIQTGTAEGLLLTRQDSAREGAEAFERACADEGIAIRAGFASLTWTTAGFPQACREALVARDFTFYSEEPVRAFRHVDRLVAMSPAEYLLPKIESGANRLLDLGDAVGIKMTLEEIIGQLCRRRVHPEDIKRCIEELANWLRVEAGRRYENAKLLSVATLEDGTLAAAANERVLTALVANHLDSIGAAVKSLHEAEPRYYVVAQAKQYVSEHYGNAGLTLQEVADRVGLSKNHFSHVFHRTTGSPFWDYVTAFRMERAKQLLRESNVSSFEISRMVGYESDTYFSKAFKRVVGKSAREFRTQ